MKTEGNIISDWIQSNSDPQIEIQVLNELVDKLIQHKDEFAIGFAEWCIQRDEHYPIQAGRITAKELLQIYKKEQGL